MKLALTYTAIYFAFLVLADLILHLNGSSMFSAGWIAGALALMFGGEA